MRAADLPSARALWELAEGVSLDVGDSLGELEAYLARNLGISQVAEQGGCLVGAVLGGHDGRRGWIYHLAVAREHRRGGIGRTLVERSLAELKREGIGRVRIFVASDNPAGLAFWKRCGWEGGDGVESLSVDL